MTGSNTRHLPDDPDYGPEVVDMDQAPLPAGGHQTATQHLGSCGKQFQTATEEHVHAFS